MKVYRPWGPFPWLWDKLGKPELSLFGVAGTEDRSLATSLLIPAEMRNATKFLRIVDPEPADPTAYEALLDATCAKLVGEGIPNEAIQPTLLLADIDEMREHVVSFIDVSSPNVLLDITVMPKWWFFPMVRFLLEDERVETLLVAYASAEKYGSSLASNTLGLQPLPTFESREGRTDHKELVVGIGFAPLELADLYQGTENVRYLFPFPPGPPHFERNWRFLQDLEERIGHADARTDDVAHRWHVNMYDCPSVFEALERFTDHGQRTTALAPFGPKTVSLAMCLFSLACEAAGRPSVPAFYTQPKRYALDYTTGMRFVDGVPDVRAYAIRIQGRDLYKLN